MEPFVPKGRREEEAVYDFAKRRFGVQAARYFFDPMVSGIYGGDSEFISVEAAFPKLFELEQEHGSVIRGMMASRGRGKFKADLKSFRRGMGQLIEALTLSAKDDIHLNEPVVDIHRADKYYMVVTDRDKYPADHVFICSPAYAAGDLFEKLDADLSTALKSIDYAPIAVTGLVFEKSSLERPPEGFGYLIPSSEGSAVLGVLAESNLYEGRAADSKVLFRVMAGGSRNPECVGRSQDEIMAMVLKEIDARYGVITSPESTFFAAHPRAIPQYETAYLTLKKRIQKNAARFPGLHLRANYLDGVSVNDCIRNAKLAADKLEMSRL